MPDQLRQLYEELKKLAADDLRSPALAVLIAEMATRARGLLLKCDLTEFKSRVAGKSYFGFLGKTASRPVNVDLYVHDSNELSTRLDSFLLGVSGTDPEEITRTAYTIALSVFTAHDVNDVGRKASATFFEILIGHMVARSVGVSPRRKVRIPESGAELPTDYVFDPGPRSRKVHLPIKTSTRERAVQAWVHQLVLDRIFGNGVYRGLLVVSGETKLNTRTGGVTEICVPRQLQMFQSRVAEISRVYYLDPPEAYLALRNAFPKIDVRRFGHIFEDINELLRQT